MNYNQPDKYSYVKFEDKDFQLGCYNDLYGTTFPHWHNHTEIIEIQKGICRVNINGKKVDAHQGDIFLIPNNSLHSIQPQEKGQYSAIVIGDDLFTHLIKDPHFKKLIEPIMNNPALNTIYINAKSNLQPKVSKIIQIIKKQYRSKGIYHALIKTELCQLFALVLENAPEIMKEKTSVHMTQTQNLKDAIDYIIENYAKKITIKDMATQMNMSEQHFSRLFKTFTGKTFIEYLTLYRLEQGNKLLLNSDLPITQIPELIGFCNANYFSRVFKEAYGYPPSKVRKH